jgi:hypothetical protein
MEINEKKKMISKKKRIKMKEKAFLVSFFSIFNFNPHFWIKCLFLCQTIAVYGRNVAKG